MKDPLPTLLALLLASGCGPPRGVAELLPGTHSEELLRLPITVPRRPAPKPNPKSPAQDDPLARAASEQLAARAPELEGVWWPTNDRLLVGMGLLGGPVKSFHTCDLSTGTLTDRTDRLLPVREESDAARNYRAPDWYRSALA